MDETEGPARAGPTAWSAALGRSICARVAGGESLSAICEEEAMPHRATVARWAVEKPRFAADLLAARTAAGRIARSQQLSTYDPATAHEICERMCEGESLAEVCRDPTMPAFGTVYRWRRAFPDFAAMMREAREVQADRFCDLGWEIASAVTPETAHATRVKLTQLRWTAGVLSPRRYGRTSPVEAEIEPQVDTLLIRTFQIEQREDGAQRVVGFCPNDETGQPERDSEGEWIMPPRPDGVRFVSQAERAAQRAALSAPRQPGAEDWL